MDELTYELFVSGEDVSETFDSMSDAQDRAMFHEFQHKTVEVVHVPTGTVLYRSNGEPDYAPKRSSR